MQITTFDCPHCGGNIKLETGFEKTVICPFCDSSVVVPEELRASGVQPQVVLNTSDPVDARTVRRGLLGILGFTAATTAIPALAGCVGIVAALIAVGAGLFFALTPATTSETVLDAIAPSPSPTPGYADLVLTLGSKGIGPGQMDDARSVAVDTDGNIYTAEYLGGRVQQFDSSGKFVTQFLVDAKTPLTGMMVDRQGILYLAQGGVITRYKGASGTVDSAITYPTDMDIEDITLAPDGGLVAFAYRSSDDIVVLGRDGSVRQTLPAAISTVSGDSELDMKVAIDGLGNIYALGTFNDAVFKFGPDGKFINRFGSDGDAPGQFTAPSSIAVDGQGNVYVTDFKGVQVFDTSGRYLGVIEVDGAASGLAFDTHGALYVVARTVVYKYVIR